MKKYALVTTVAAMAGLVAGRLVPVQSQTQVRPATSWAAVPGEKVAKTSGARTPSL